MSSGRRTSRALQSAAAVRGQWRHRTPEATKLNARTLAGETVRKRLLGDPEPHGANNRSDLMNPIKLRSGPPRSRPWCRPDRFVDEPPAPPRRCFRVRPAPTPIAPSNDIERPAFLLLPAHRRRPKTEAQPVLALMCVPFTTGLRSPSCRGSCGTTRRSLRCRP